MDSRLDLYWIASVMIADNVNFYEYFMERLDRGRGPRNFLNNYLLIKRIA